MDFPTNDQSVGLVNGRFSDGSPITGEKGSRDKAVYQNMLYDELIAVIQNAGITPNVNDSTQVLKAIRKIFGRPRLVWEKTTSGQSSPVNNIGILGLNSAQDGFYTLHFSFEIVSDPPTPYHFWIYPNSIQPTSGAYETQSVSFDNEDTIVDRGNEPIFFTTSNSGWCHGVMEICSPVPAGGFSAHTRTGFSQDHTQQDQVYINHNNPASMGAINTLIIQSKNKPLIKNFKGRLFCTDQP